MSTVLLDKNTLRSTFRDGRTYDQVVADNLKFTNGWPIHERQLKMLLGLPEKEQKRLSASFCLGWTKVGNVNLYIMSSAQAKAAHPKSRFGHRVIAQCPHCQAQVSAGRFSQHMKIH